MTVAGVVAVGAMLLGAPGDPSCAAELFRVSRSTNANVVVYESPPRGSGEGGPSVHPVWLMLAEDGHREELSGLERSLAYGIEAHAADDPEAAWATLAAQPQRPILLRWVGHCPVAIATIAGRPAALQEIFVDVGGVLLPEVRSVELIGVDLETGREVRERVTNTE